ncbi:MAG: NUDIX hydrolase [Nitrososphaerota archaeon]
MKRAPEIISTRGVYDGRLIAVKLIRARYGEEEVEREVVEHPGSVAIVATDSVGRFLLVKQYRVGVGEDTIEIPAGTLEEGEEPLKCAERELEEETGYRALDLHPLANTYTSPGYTSERLYIFTAKAVQGGVSKHETDENIRVIRLSREEVLEAISRGEIRDLKSIAGLLMAIFLRGV